MRPLIEKGSDVFIRFNKAIAIYNINGFFNELDIMMDKSIDKQFITGDCKELYSVFDDIEKMLEYLENYDEKDIDLNKVKIR